MTRHPLRKLGNFGLVLAVSVLVFARGQYSPRAEKITFATEADGAPYESALIAESSGIGPTLFVARILQSGRLLRRGLVRFELPEDLSAGAQIDATEWGVRLSRKAPDLVDTTLTLHRVLQAWGEETSNAGGLGGLGVDASDSDVTWETSVFASTAWSQTGDSYVEEASASVTMNDLGNIYWETSPGMVDDLTLWLAQPELNYGWLIRGDGTQMGTAERPDSRQNAAVARPSLMISYCLPEPGVLVTLGIGGLALALCNYRGRAAGLATFLAVSIATAEPGWAQGDFLPSIPLGPHTIRFEKLADGLNREVAGVQQFAPTDMVFPNDGSGRMFITTLGGLIRVGDLSSGVYETPYLNTVNGETSIVPDSYGMTAMTFHPGFGDPSSVGYKKFYTLETEYRNSGVDDLPLSLTGREQHQTVLYEYVCDDPTANVFQGFKRRVFRVSEPGSSHNSNELTFGPDGYLYIAAGDGCNVGNSTDIVCSDNAQFLGNTFGKILRIDPIAPAATPLSDDAVSPNGRYRIPADNPFVQNPAALGEIYAYGLRNPYRLSFDRETGRLYTGDVGQRHIESVDEIIKGGNYGWNDMEGTFLYDKSNQDALTPDQDLDGNGLGEYAESQGYLEPLLQYDHQDGKSVTGGYVYRGSLFPEFEGKYVFGDFRGQLANYVGRMFLGDFGTGQIEELNISLAGLAQPDLIYAFSEDENGEIYLLGGENDGSTGVIYRLVRENPYGDTNADGKVDLVDLNEVRNNFGGTGIGDANLDGKVNLIDLNAVRNNFGAGNATLVPEPASIALLSMGMTVILARRRRQSLALPL